MLFKIKKESDKQGLIDYILGLKFPKERWYEVEVSGRSFSRTTNQNRLYRLWLKCLSEELGYTTDELHQVMVEKFIGIKSQEIAGVTTKSLPSTTKLSKTQFREFLDKIQLFASVDLGVTLPNPEDRYWEQFENHYRKNF